MNHTFSYINEPAQLSRMLEEIAGADSVGIDTESDSFYHYQEQVCLIQATAGQRDYVIDPLALDDLSPLAPLLADPGVVKVFHGADYDIASLKRDYDVQVAPVFDTMLAAQALGYEHYSLADLVLRFFDVKLDKRYQRMDWSRRPLADEHLSYARLDSHFLPTLRGLLWDEVVAADRRDQVTEECRRLEQRERHHVQFDPDDFIRIRGAGRLDDRGKRVLRALYVMRDGMARARNRPHFKVIGNEALLRIAAKPAGSTRQLTEQLGEKHHVVRRFAEPVVAACREGLADRVALPRCRPEPRGPRRLTGPEENRAFVALRNWRNTEAAERGVEPGVLLPNAVLQEIVVSHARRPEDLLPIDAMRDWQRAELGPRILEVLAEASAGKA